MMRTTIRVNWERHQVQELLDYTNILHCFTKGFEVVDKVVYPYGEFLD